MARSPTSPSSSSLDTHTPARHTRATHTNDLISRTMFAHTSPAEMSCSSSSLTSSTAATRTTNVDVTSNPIQFRISHCSDPDECSSLDRILQCFNSAISEDQAWAIIHQSVQLYRDARREPGAINQSLLLVVPDSVETLCLHRDGTVHVDILGADNHAGLSDGSSQRSILYHLGNVVYQARQYNANTDDTEHELSAELDDVLRLMTFDDDEGIENDPDPDDIPDHQPGDTRHLDLVLDICCKRIQPNPRNHYRAVCRALVTEFQELQSFLQKISRGDSQQLQLEADVEASTDLQQFGFSDWARFWVQVVAELRQGVRLKKHNYSRPSQVFELTPFEIIMEDIRSRNFELKKVIMNSTF